MLMETSKHEEIKANRWARKQHKQGTDANLQASKPVNKKARGSKQ